MADQAPQAKLKANWRNMVVSYGIVAEVTGPSYIDLQVHTYYVFFPTEFRPEFLSPEFRTKLILPWNDLIPTCVPTGIQKCHGIPQIPKNDAQQESE